MLDIGIVIVNWNTKDLLRTCLASLRASDASVSRRVILVDNASTDGSANMVRTEFPEVVVIENSHNGGFSEANNIGLKLLGFTNKTNEASNPDQPRYALLLNPDTVVPMDGLRKAIDRADADPKIGVLGVRLELPDGSLDLACKRSFPTPEVMMWHVLGFGKLFPRSKRFGRYNLTYLDEHQEAEVDCVVGAYMMARQEAILKVGLLDEAFWMYAEDIDWAFRIKQAGWKVLYYPAVTVLHVKRAASRQNPRTRIEFQRASLIFYRKHYAATTSPLMNLAVLAGIAFKGGRPLWKEIQSSH